VGRARGLPVAGAGTSNREFFLHLVPGGTALPPGELEAVLTKAVER
jgi:hypothetical protein